jgi:hypothetical protein
MEAPTAAIRADLETLRLFNRKVDRLEQSGFWKRYENEVPNVVAKFGDVRFEKTGEARFDIIGRVHSWLEDFSQDEIDAFVLTYRIFTQNNDPLSIASLARVYESDWLRGNARECFEGARQELNDYLDTYTKIDFGDGPIRVRTLVDIVVYGGLAHSERRKARIFESWESSGFMGFVWGEFYAYAREATELLKYFRTLNAGLLDGIERHGFTADPDPLP